MRDFLELQNVILVGGPTLQKAVTFIKGCEFCSPQTARLSLDDVLDRVTGNSRSVTEYLLVECTARCPRCQRQICETTLVEVGE
ncbi:MAG TPA: hypothetical protein VFE29_00105 [Terriglobia bacterium]|nr:hypothetical protein [Terriglobia bacterium]